MSEIEIPIKPLSVNKVWQGRRFKTKDYKDYEKNCLWFIKGEKIKGEIEIYYKFYVKNFLMCDVDNFIKPIQDIIVKAGLIEDDRFIKRIIAEKFKSENEKIVIDIKRLN